MRKKTEPSTLHWSVSGDVVTMHTHAYQSTKGPDEEDTP